MKVKLLFKIIFVFFLYLLGIGTLFSNLPIEVKTYNLLFWTWALLLGLVFEKLFRGDCQ